MARSLRSVLQFFVNLLSRLRKWLNKIGSPFRINRRFVRNLDSLARSGKTQGGFVLPVVALVTTAVTLLVVVTVSRSADRAQNAANNRVQEAFRSANTPIIDRGRLKIAKLISDTEQQQRTTPSDTLLNTVFQGTDFTLPDEIRLQINTEFDGTSGFKYTATTIADNEVSNTAWKFPIDTDGNGRFDTFGLYSIQFRAKPVTGAYLNRAVSPLESRSKPMEAGTLSGNCAGAAANVATNEGWESGTDGKLRKAFFVYATTIPITTLPTAAEIGGSTSTPSGNIANYEVFRGSRVFSALELQQDRLRTPLNNNAVWFEGDVELARAATFRLNGRVYSGGNLMIGSLTGNPITFYQVSASNNDADASNGTDAGSCYYSEDNSVVIVAGNTVEGDALSTDTSLGGADFHLFLKDNANPLSNTSLGVATLNDSTQSVISAANNRGADVLFNELELTRRVFRLVNQVLTVASPSGALYTGTTPVTIPAAPAVVSYQNVAYDDPYTVKVSTAKRIVDEGLSTKAEFDLARRSAYEQYFRDRLRKVPSIEVGFSAAVTKLNSTPALSGDPTSILARQTVTNPDGTTGYEWLPPVEWLIPFDGNGASLNRSVSSYTTGGTRYNGRGLLSLSTSAGGTAPTATITLNVNSSTKLANPPAVDPKDAATRKNTYLGDRILVGNNLPARWPYFDADGKFSYIDASKQQTYAFGVASNAVFWNSPTNIATATTSERTRTTQAYTLESLGVSDRNGFWELSATANPADPNPLPAANQVNTVANSTPTTGGLRVVVNSGIYTKLTPAEMGSVRTVDAPGTFLPPYHTGVSDDPATTTIDESAAPMYDSNLEDSFGNLIDTRRFAAPDNSATTTTDESKTQNFVVWPDSMPLSPEIRWLSAATTPAVAAANAGYYRIKPAVNDLTQYSSYTNNNGATIDSTTTTQIPLTADNIPRGNLQMRAAAVYHYKYDSFNANALTQSDYQRPVACVSSYYDNSFSYLENPFAAPSTTNSRISTAFNRSGARWNDGSATGVFGKGGLSNNGIVYTPVTHAGNMPALASGIVYNAATGLFSGYADGARNPADGNIAFGDRLAYQANLIFPNGRLVNEPLRKVLLKMLGDGTTSNPLNNRNPALAKLTIAEQSTLDANLCALQIMQSSGSSGASLTATAANTAGTGGAADVAPNAVNGAKLPHGAIKESAFLDGREVKSLNRNENMYSSSTDVTDKSYGSGREARLVSGNSAGTASIGFSDRPDIYDLDIEQRQPLEIRVTDLDMDMLRGGTVTGGNNTGITTEYLLPYSGLVYATREDALKDLSDNTNSEPVTRTAISATDAILDPSRRPSGIRLINGYRLWRGTSSSPPDWTEATKGEKGLVLASNLPVYIKAQKDPFGFTPAANRGGFNVHQRGGTLIQEFNTALNEDTTNATTQAAIWDNFYTRLPSDRNANFACRKGDPRCGSTGDEWRPATVIADAFTVQSASFRDGYRSDGDYDLRNNENTSTSPQWQDIRERTTAEQLKDSPYVLDRRKMGLWNNNFVTSANWMSGYNSDGQVVSTIAAANPFPLQNLSSFNGNGVTPIQRRIESREYGMEICRKLPVSRCTFADWVKDRAGTTALPDSATYSTTTYTPSTPTGLQPQDRPRWIDPQDSRYARRLSFLRFDDIYKDGNMQLVMAQQCQAIAGQGRRPGDSSGQTPAWPIPIGVMSYTGSGYDPNNTNNNGNADAGNRVDSYTYPHIIGVNQDMPFNATSGTRFVAYGTVPCPPEAKARVYFSDPSGQSNAVRYREITEGAQRNSTITPTLLTTLPTPSMANVLAWSRPTNNSSSGPSTGDPAAGGTNDAAKVYRIFRFRVTVDNLSGITSNPARVRIRLASGIDTTVATATTTNSTAGFAGQPGLVSNTGTKQTTAINPAIMGAVGSAAQAVDTNPPITSAANYLNATAIAALSPAISPAVRPPDASPVAAASQTGTDFLNQLYLFGSNRGDGDTNSYCLLDGTSTASQTDGTACTGTTNTTALVPLPVVGTLTNGGPNVFELTFQNSEITNTLGGAGYSNSGGTLTKDVAVLVVRDRAAEPEEYFTLSLQQAPTSTEILLSNTTGAGTAIVGRIRQDTPAAQNGTTYSQPVPGNSTCTPPIAPVASVATTIVRTSDDMPIPVANIGATPAPAPMPTCPPSPTPTPPPTTTPAPTPTPTPTPASGGTMLPPPVFGTLHAGASAGTGLMPTAALMPKLADVNQSLLGVSYPFIRTDNNHTYLRCEGPTVNGTTTGFGGTNYSGLTAGTRSAPVTPITAALAGNYITFTANATADSITPAAGTYVVDQALRFIAGPGATLPGGLSAGTTYYVKSVATGVLTLSATAPSASGAVVNITSTGSGSFGIVNENCRVDTPQPAPIATTAPAPTLDVLANRKTLYGIGTQADLPPNPNDFDTVNTAAVDGATPLVAGMTKNYPNASARNLWFRTTGRTNWLAEANTVDEGWNTSRSLFINQMPWPAIGGGTGNPYFASRMILPETPCIDTTNGQVDQYCSLSNLAIGVTAATSSPTTLANLNVPWNPMFPSNNAGGINTVDSTSPASAFAVCGATGNSRRYQSSTWQNADDFTESGTTNGCASAVRTSVQDFYNDLMATSLDPANAYPTTFKAINLANSTTYPLSMRSGAVASSLTNSAATLYGSLGRSTSGTETMLTITAKNTFADNRVNVINLCNLPGIATRTDLAADGSAATTDDGTAACATADVNATSPSTASRDTTVILRGTLKLVANQDADHTSRGPSPVFILRGSPFNNVSLEGLRVQLDGVEPNNVFWVIPRVNRIVDRHADAFTIKEDNRIAGAVYPSAVTGNFIGRMGTTTAVDNKTVTTTLNIANNVDIRGARFLGFRSVMASSVADAPSCTVAATTDRSACVGPDSSFGAISLGNQVVATAITTVDQPQTVPVLQIHAPTYVSNLTGQGTIGDATSQDGFINGDPTANSGRGAKWIQQADDTEVNVYIVAGNQPSRSYATLGTLPNNLNVANGTTLADSNGGLHNFVRFMENWFGSAAKISGGFIQNTRTVYATGPFQPTSPYLPMSSGTPNVASFIQTAFLNPLISTNSSDLMRWQRSTFLPGWSYASATGATQQLPYYGAPLRLWGFDVGLLTQSPDRFAERFAKSLPNPNEFFREVDRSDRWVQSLLCAVQPPNVGTTNTAARQGGTTVAANTYTVWALRGQKDLPAQCSNIPTTTTLTSGNYN